jgi:hypothetical protein
MMKLFIRTENEAFTGDAEPGTREASCMRDAEVARILMAIANRLIDEGSSEFYTTILDTNGNDVGRWKLADGDFD